MGFMTLANFKTELDSILGARGTVTARLTTWTNLGYFDAAGAVDFRETEATTSVNTAAADFDYAVPAGWIEMFGVYDSVAKFAPREVDIVEFNRQDRTLVGPPKLWARHAGLFYLHPTPNDTRALVLFGRAEPVALAADGDLTVLQRTWDAAVLMLAASYGFHHLNEEARAITWYNRAIQYMQSRALGGKMNLPPPPAG
jgi:hypothetical protein